jgi:hypothetical protein
MRAAEVAHHVFLSVAAFLVRDDNATLRTERGQTARHRLVIGEMAVAMQLDPARETALNVIEREGPLHVPRDLHALPCGQAVVNLPPRFANLVLDRFDLGIKIDIVFVGMLFEVLQLTLQLKDRLFKIERVRVHRATQ